MLGRFLQLATSKAFQWVPGIKAHYNGANIDIDCVAICDEHLVLAECKSLEESGVNSKAWPEIAKQVLTLVHLAKILSADAVFVAALVDEYPENFLRDISDASKDMPVIFLTSQELTTGSIEIDGKICARPSIEHMVAGGKPKKYVDVEHFGEGPRRMSLV